LLTFKLSAKDLIISVAETKLRLNDCIKSLFLVSFRGLRSMDPTQYAKPFTCSSLRSFTIFSEKFSSKTSHVVNVELSSFASFVSSYQMYFFA
jgi:hypothetical protein